MLENLTYICDRVRIQFGNSKCPLAKRCQGYDADNNCCAASRGRDEIGGERAECYAFLNPK